MKLKEKELGDAFAAQVWKNAPRAFFHPDDPDSLYFRADVPGRIRQEFSFLLDATVYRPIPKYYLSILPTAAILNPVTDYSISVTTTEYVSADDYPVARWKTEIVFARIYEEKNPALPYLRSTEWIRKLSFECQWQSHLNADGTLSDVRLSKILKPAVELRSALFSDYSQSRLPSPFQRMAEKYQSQLPETPENPNLQTT